MRVVIGLFPDLLAPGGIQRAGRHVAAVLAGFARGRGTSYRFLSLNDPAGRHTIRVGEHDFVISGFRRSKLRFVAAALHAARRRPSLVVAAHPNLAPVARAMRILSPGSRVLVLTHGIEVWTPLPRLRREALRRADRVLAPSADTAAKVMAQQGVPKEKIVQVPWGLDPQFSPLEAWGTNHLPAGFPAGLVVLTVGRWAASERYKGVDHLISATARLLPRIPDLYLVAVGEGDDRGRLERLANDLGIAERVRFLNGLTQEQLAASYERCAVFALPSRGEGFGMVFLEAMAHGKPVIGGAHGGTPDIIQENVTGRTVAHGDVGALAGALEELLTDEPLRSRMGASARERVRSHYLFGHFSARLERVLANLCPS